jgi:carbonic anhydrase
MYKMMNNTKIPISLSLNRNSGWFFRVNVIRILLGCLLIIGFASCKNTPSAKEQTPTTPEGTLQLLLKGNERFSQSKSIHPDENIQRLKEVVSAQHPLAVIVSCSDSRVSPEIVFDQGVGDLFVIRTAGNIISGLEIGSIEYAVEHLGVKLIVIMGHESCGAVKAFVEGGEAPGHIKEIIDSLGLESEIMAISKLDENRLDDCVRANVLHGVKQLVSQSSIIREKIEKGTLHITGTRYDLHDYKVTVIKK